jgi:hypothetical protein
MITRVETRADATIKTAVRTSARKMSGRPNTPCLFRLVFPPRPRGTAALRVEGVLWTFEGAAFFGGREGGFFTVVMYNFGFLLRDLKKTALRRGPGPFMTQQGRRQGALKWIFIVPLVSVINLFPVICQTKYSKNIQKISAKR